MTVFQTSLHTVEDYLYFSLVKAVRKMRGEKQTDQTQMRRREENVKALT